MKPWLKETTTYYITMVLFLTLLPFCMADGSGDVVARPLGKIEIPVLVKENKCVVSYDTKLADGQTKKPKDLCVGVTCKTAKKKLEIDYCDNPGLLQSWCPISEINRLDEFPWCCPAVKCASPSSSQRTTRLT
uniref:Putative 8.9 kDa family member n=1 Tax=Rhipicephalus pulchellus TaxID=72859 RepID=L7MC35_RHIPC